MTVGYQEVEHKRTSWLKLDKEKRCEAMSQELFPAIKGPGKNFYILDHHHTAAALVRERSERVQVGLVERPVSPGD